jgi:hypothetical protein
MAGFGIEADEELADALAHAAIGFFPARNGGGFRLIQCYYVIFAEKLQY